MYSLHMMLILHWLGQSLNFYIISQMAIGTFPGKPLPSLKANMYSMGLSRQHCFLVRDTHLVKTLKKYSVISDFM